MYTLSKYKKDNKINRLLLDGNDDNISNYDYDVFNYDASEYGGGSGDSSGGGGGYSNLIFTEDSNDIYIFKDNHFVAEELQRIAGSYDDSLFSTLQLDFDGNNYTLTPNDDVYVYNEADDNNIDDNNTDDDRRRHYRRWHHRRRHHRPRLIFNTCKYKYALLYIARRMHISISEVYAKYKTEADELFSIMIKKRNYKEGEDYLYDYGIGYYCAEVRIKTIWNIFKGDKYKRRWKVFVILDIEKMIKNPNKHLVRSILHQAKTLRIRANLLTDEAIKIIGPCKNDVIQHRDRYKNIRKDYIRNNMLIPTHSRLLLHFKKYIENDYKDKRYTVAYSIYERPIEIPDAYIVHSSAYRSEYRDSRDISALVKVEPVKVSILGEENKTYINPGDYKVRVVNGSNATISLTNPLTGDRGLISKLFTGPTYYGVINTLDGSLDNDSISLTKKSSTEENDNTIEYYDLHIPESTLGSIYITCTDKCGNKKIFEYELTPTNMDIILIESQIPVYREDTCMVTFFDSDDDASVYIHNECNEDVTCINGEKADPKDISYICYRESITDYTNGMNNFSNPDVHLLYCYRCIPKDKQDLLTIETEKIEMPYNRLIIKNPCGDSYTCGGSHKYVFQYNSYGIKYPLEECDHFSTVEYEETFKSVDFVKVTTVHGIRVRVFKLTTEAKFIKILSEPAL